jgi:ABC-2 type transport system permease protein
MNSIFIAINIMKRTLAQKKGWLYYIILPIVFISMAIQILGQSNSEHVTLGVLNLDKGQYSTLLMTRLADDMNLKLIPMDSKAELQDQVLHNQVHAAFVIPENFTNNLLDGTTYKIQMFELNQSEVTHWLQLKIQAQASRLLQPVYKLPLGDGPILDKHLSSISGLNTAVGLLLMFMMNFTNSTISILSKDRRERIIMRVYAAPVRAIEIMLGHFLGSFLAGSLQISIVVLFTRYILGFNYGIELFQQMLLLELFLLISIGLSTALANSFYNNRYMSAIETMVIIPSCMIGGCFWSIGLMPDFMQKLANFTPQKWVIEAVTLLSEGQSLIDIRMLLGILALFATVLLTFGMVLLKPEDQ